MVLVRTGNGGEWSSILTGSRGSSCRLYGKWRGAVVTRTGKGVGSGCHLDGKWGGGWVAVVTCTGNGASSGCHSYRREHLSSVQEMGWQLSSMQKMW